MSSFISPFKVCGACGSVGENARHNYQQNCPIFVATIFKELAAASLSQLNLFPRVGYTHRHGGAYAFYQYLPVLRDAPHRPTIIMSTYLRLGYPVILVRARTGLRRRNHLQTAGVHVVETQSLGRVRSFPQGVDCPRTTRVDFPIPESLFEASNVDIKPASDS